MISIIIPTFNEELKISNTLSHVFSLNGLCEVLVVDGGSHDNTVNIVEADGRATLVKSKKGRGTQMNAGAKHARGEILLFLHADTLLPIRALQIINSIENDLKINAGGFRQQFSGKDWRLRLISYIDNYRCQKSKIIYGDQALFVRASLFRRLGGFPNQSVLEDWAFGRMLCEVTSPIIINDPVITDSRKFEKAGIWKSFVQVTAILTRLKLGLPVSNQHPFFQDIR